MSKAIVPQNEQSSLAIAGQVANKYAAANVFKDHKDRLSVNSLRAQAVDLKIFEQFLKAIGVVIEVDEDLAKKSEEENVSVFAISPSVWQDVTHGLIEAFRNGQLKAGYAIGTINRRLATVKKYAALAFKAGTISTTEAALIKTVEGYSSKHAHNIDRQRQAAGQGTRILEAGRPAKKGQNVQIPEADVKSLKHEHENNPQGRRDAVIFCLLLDHGLRASELAALTVGNIDLKAGKMRFHRQKVNKDQTHNLTADSLKALRAYISHDDAPSEKQERLLKASKKTGELTHTGLSERSISRIVNQLGEAIGLKGLSAHDCRHSWATRAAAAGTSPFALQEAGGWNSLAMPRRYIDEQAIANEGVKLPY